MKKVEKMEEERDFDGSGEESREPDELYDERKDDRDARFVQARRVSTITDGTLSCPSCFTVVCYECQQHVEYDHQFRAISAVNVKVCACTHGGRRTFANFFSPSAQIKHDKALQYGALEAGGAPESYMPVACGVCGYELAVYGPDNEDTFHFFAVICSEPQ
jgi:hypothetical protein